MAEFYVTVEGTKQGTFKGESVRDKRTDQLDGISFHYTVSAPRDTATGMATGKRQHQPVSFVKRWGAASPMLYQAIITNEVLKSVRFEFVQVNEQGEEYVFQTIELTNASVSEIEQYVSGEPEPPADTRALEKVSFAFQKIEITNTDGKTSVIDDLKGRP